MDDPFSDLRIRREALEEQEKRQETEEAQEYKLLAKAVQEKRHAEENYKELVEGVLGQLRQAAYPLGQLRTYYSKSTFSTTDIEVEIGWCIELLVDVPISDWPGSSREWHKVVLVVLKFDFNNKPTCFECSVRSKTARAGLSREELINVLKQLHYTPPLNASQSKKKS